MRGVWSSFLLIFSMVLASWGQTVSACSSCGSGGADPVVLNPNESGKFYLGLSHQSGFQDIDRLGNRQKSYGPKQKQSLDLAFAQRLTSRVFASAVMNFGRNVYGPIAESQNGDASLNVRANAMQQNIAEPWIPQLQILLGHRFALGRSVNEQKRERFLDVFGAGYDESYLGADLWYGMQTVMAGGSVLFGFPAAEETDFGSLQRGRLQRIIATIGFLPLAEVKVIGGFIQEQRGGSEVDGVAQEDSDKLSQDLFLTSETLFPEGSNYRLTLSSRGAFGELKNATQAKVISLAWMRPL